MAITPILAPPPFRGPVPGSMPGTMAWTSGAGDDPFNRDSAVWAQMPGWEVMSAVLNGSDYIRAQCHKFLLQEPKEDEKAWQKRVRRSVLAPYTVRLIENAAGLVLRRPIELEGGDDFWRETFQHDVDGLGSSINEFARRRLVNALAYGHSAIMVDYPQTNARTLLEERLQNAQPYWSGIDAQQILGWRQASRVPSSPLVQLRVLEMQSVPEGEYGEKIEEVVRVLRPGSYECITRGGDVVERGTYTLDRIPVVPVYTHRNGMLQSSPPLIDIAYLNITHYQRLADLLHALHLAAMPILVLEGWDQENSTTGVNYAIGMEPGNKAYYVESDASSFQAQNDLLRSLEEQMSHLGISKLLGQKMVAEAADAKRLDQQQANSVLAIISMELEQSLNEALGMSAEYMGLEPPVVKIARDFDLYRLLGQDVSVLSSMEQLGQITPGTFLRILRAGEWLNDGIDLEKELAETERLKEERKQEQEEMMKQQAAMKQPPNQGGKPGNSTGGNPPRARQQ